MEEISGCDSASTNAIQARLACPRQFLTPSTLPLGLGCPRPNTSCVEGMGQGGFLAPSVGSNKGMWCWLRPVNPCAHPLLPLGCSADGLVEVSLALSRH